MPHTRDGPSGATPANPAPNRSAPIGPEWWIFAGVGLALSIAYIWLPESVRTITYVLISFATVAALIVAARRCRGPARLVWILFAAGQLFYAFGDTAYNVTEAVTGTVATPSYIDVLYLAYYPLVTAGLVIMARLRRAIQGWDAVGDALTAGIGGALLIWQIAQPVITSQDASPGETTVNLAYPVGDVVLIMLIVRLAVGPGSRPPALWLLIVSNVWTIAADLIFASYTGTATTAVTNTADVLFQLGYVAFGLAALHPSMPQITQPAPPEPRSLVYRRVGLLLLAGLLPPVLFITSRVLGEQGTLIPFIVGTSALYLLLLIRLIRMIRLQEKAVREDNPPWVW